MKGKVIEKIASFKSSATKKEKLIIERIKNIDPNELIYMSITELSDKIDVTEATILRFCKKIGYSGFQDFKLAMSQDIAVNSSLHLSGTMETSLYKIQSGLDFSVKNLDTKQIKKVAEHILKSKKICIFGIGNSYISTLYFYNSLVKAGINIWISADTHIRNMLAINLTEDDFVLLMSASGETSEILDLARTCKKIKIPTAVITNKIHSSLAEYATYLFVSSNKEKEFDGSELSSIISQIFILDILAQTILEKLYSH